MLDIGWTELLVIGIVALIVVGPKDLPVMFRTLGRFTGKLRAMARDFTRAMEEAADEAGVKDVAKDLRRMTDPKSMGADALKKATSMEDLDFDPFGEDDEVADEESATPAKKTEPRGPQTAKMTEERAEAARKIQQSAAARAAARLEAEAAARAAETAAAAPEAAAETASDTTSDKA